MLRLREGAFCLAAGVYFIWLSHKEIPSARREDSQHCPTIIPISKDTYERSTPFKKLITLPRYEIEKYWPLVRRPLLQE